MKKICICTTVSLTMKSFVVETAKYLHSKEGYDVTLVCNDDEDFRNSLPNYIHFIPVHMERGIDLSGFVSMINFIKIFRKENFDLVQYSTPNASCYASIAAKICKVPVRLYCQWGIRYVGLEGKSRTIFKFLEKLVCKNSTDIRAVSNLNRKFAISEGLYSLDKSAVIGNGGTIGVDLDQYNILDKPKFNEKIRSLYNISNNQFVYGFVGRVSADKGCTELLQSFKEISKVKSDVILLIIGPVEDNCGVPIDILDWARQSKQVIMTGMIDKSKMNEYYSTIDVLVHPTYREGFGMVLQEAGAMECGIITTRIPGASEVMVENESCLLSEPKDVDSLFECMNKVYENSQLFNLMKKNARQRVVEKFDRCIMLENQRKDYVSLLKG